MNITTPETYEREERNRKRHRVLRACDTCRHKKIKCDVDINQPCTTCVQYESVCTFDDMPKRKGPRKGYIDGLESRLEQMESLLKSMGQNITELTYENDENVQAKREGEEIEEESTTRYHGSSSGFHVLSNLFSQEGGHKDENSRAEGATLVIENQDEQNVFAIPPVYGKGTYRFKRLNEDESDLMVFKNRTTEEEAFQAVTGSQDEVKDFIPRSLISSLVNVYFSSKLLLPIVDREEYMKKFEGRESSFPLTLLTCAICTFACLLVKREDTMFEKAPVNRDEIYRILCNMAIPLLDNKYLSPSIPTIQALLLYANQPASSNNSDIHWIFAGMAVRMAQDLGLHRNIQVSGVDESNIKRKRLWYSVYVTDRWCCTILERPLAISDSDCDIDMSLSDPNKPEEDLTIFLNFIKLSKILGEVLRRVYSLKAKSNGYKTKAIEQTVLGLEKMLDDWYANVPESHKMTEADLHGLATNQDLYTNKMTQGGPLTICYYFVIILLHRPFLIMEKEGTDTPFLAKSAAKCIKMAKLVITASQYIATEHLSWFGWNTACYSIFSAAMIQAFISTSSDSKLADEARELFRISVDDILEPIISVAPNEMHMLSFLHNIPSLLARSTLASHDSCQGQQGTANVQCFGPSPDQISPNSSKGPFWLFNSRESLLLQGLFPQTNTVFPEKLNKETLEK